MKDILFERVYLLGTGLIGGSLALDLRKRGLVNRILGSDMDPVAQAQALELGILSEKAPFDENSLAGCDLIILSVPVVALESIIRSGFPPKTLVTDVGSVKLPLIKAFRESADSGSSYRYVPGHPIAGDERSGPTAARTGLFEGAKVIITPVEDEDDDVERIAHMWQRVGSVVEIMEPELHDAIFAWVSHLPHMAAYGIVDSVLKKDESWVSFSGGGLRDYTRIAASNPAMWADIAISNKEYLLGAMRDLGSRLGEIEKLISAGDRTDLVEFFEQIAKVRRKMK
ncbi:MAG: prephenate dehydrogenase [bacterium]